MLHVKSFMLVTVDCAKKKSQWPCAASWKLVKYLSGIQHFTAEVAPHQDGPNLHYFHVGAPSKLQWGLWSCCPGTRIKSQQKGISCPELDVVLPGSKLTVIHSSLLQTQASHSSTSPHTYNSPQAIKEFKRWGVCRLSFLSKLEKKSNDLVLEENQRLPTTAWYVSSFNFIYLFILSSCFNP